MMSKTIYDKHFEKIDFNALDAKVYDGCSFTNCQFSNVDLSHFDFSDCEFTQCDLSTSKLIDTGMKDIRFYECKLLGLHFKDCKKFLFQVQFQDCNLELASFFELSLKQMSFIDCNLKEVDFAEADLSHASFDGCNLLMALFDQSTLQHTDFRSAKNYSIDPEMNRISKAKFSNDGLAGLLEKYDILIS